MKSPGGCIGAPLHKKTGFLRNGDKDGITKEAQVEAAWALIGTGAKRDQTKVVVVCL